MEETLSKFMRESEKIHEENSNLIKEIRASTDAAIRNQGALIKTLEIQIGQISKVLQERGFGSLPRSTETNPRDHVKSILTIVEADTSSIRRIGSHQYAISTEQNSTLMYETKQTTIPFPNRLNNYYYEDKKGSYGPQFLKAYSYEASHIDKSIPRKEKDLGSFTLPCYINNVYFDNALADLGASDVKYPKGIAENVLVGIGKFVFPVDFIILDMPEDVIVPLILGRPFLSTTHAKIDVFKRKITLRVGEEKIIFKSVKPANLRRDQVDDLMPTIEEGEVVEEFRARNDARMVSKNFGYPIDCDHDKKIRIDCAQYLKFSCMIDFAVLEDMDAYRDEGMGDVIFGEPFLREVRINAKRFEGMITIHNGNEEVTYQMVPSHSRFKYHTNE
ncbi:mitochondrial proton/calcium exchanger protein-like protein isoform X1 [Tanacetum coccineum]